MTTKKTYTKEFKCEAVRLQETSDKTGAEVSRQLGIKGNCHDNAVAESFFHTLKEELVTDADYKTRNEARQSIFNTLNCFTIENDCTQHSTTMSRWCMRRCRKLLN
jgi:transposase InsO family protein